MKPPKIIRTKYVSPSGKMITETITVMSEDDNFSRTEQSVFISISTQEDHGHSSPSSSCKKSSSFSS